MLRVDPPPAEGLTYRLARLTELGLASFEPELEHLVIYRRSREPNPATGSPIVGQASIRSMAASTDSSRPAIASAPEISSRRRSGTAGGTAMASCPPRVCNAVPIWNRARKPELSKKRAAEKVDDEPARLVVAATERSCEHVHVGHIDVTVRVDDDDAVA